MVFMSLISSIASKGYEFLSTIHLDSPSNILKKAGSIAIPTLTLLALANIPTVMAKEKEYIECLDACLKAGNGPMKCFFMCIIFAF